MSRFLVIDDEPDFRAMMQFTLGADGHEVHEAADGAAGLAALEAGPVDAVVLDVHLAAESGLDVLAAIRRRWPAQRVVLVSSGLVHDPESDRDDEGRGGGDAGAGATGAPAPAATAPAAPQADAFLRKPFQLEELRTVLEALLPRKEIAPVAKAHVLVVDDEADLRDMLTFTLVQEGYEVESADSGEAAVEAAHRRKFDLCITDLKMPGMGGVAAVSALKQLDPDLEIIVATGYASVDTAISCMRAGAYDYVCKPYNLADLTRLMERALERRRLQGTAALYESTQVLLATPRDQDLAQIALDRARRLFGADGVGLVLAEDDQRTRTVRWEGTLAETPLDLLGRLTARADEARVPLRLARGGDDAALLPEPFAAALLFPLVARERFLGALAILRDLTRPPFGAGDLQRGAVFSSQLAMALFNADLYRALEATIAQLIATREQLVRSEKLSLAGALAGAVAHEVNNPLAVLQSNLQGLSDVVAQGRAEGLSARLADEATEMLADALDGSRRLGTLVADFRGLGGEDVEGRRETFDVGDLLQAVVAATRAHPELGSLALRVVAAAAPSGAPPAVRAAAVAADVERALVGVLQGVAERAAVRGDASPTPVVLRYDSDVRGPRILVEDPRSVLDPAEQARLFEPRLGVDASGHRRMRLHLGLPIAERLLRRNAGSLEVAPGATGGTVFAVRLAGPPS
ncbi:MAG TPA: response regulator [Myxococcota bacterium]|nr:response regulator [Myxococcota bacterium]